MTAIGHTENPGRKTFAFYWSFKDAIRDMPDADKLAVYEAITDFAFFGVDPNGLSPVGRLAWKLIRPQLEASIRRYDACRNNGLKGAEYGKNGGAPKGNQNARKQPQRITPEDNPKNNPLNHNVNDNANVNVNEKGVIGGEVATKRRAFVAPSLEMVKDYFLTINGSDTDSECFYDHFTANGWRTGKNPIKDWKAAARNWMRRKSEFNATTQKQTTHETRKTNFL